MVTIYGLSDAVGNLSYYDSSGQQEYSFGKPYSEETAKLIDKEISKIVESQYQRAVEILSTHRNKLDALASKLLDKEVIFRRSGGNLWKRAWDPELTEQPLSATTENDTVSPINEEAKEL